jgi:uncharacterized protein YcfL
VKKNYIIITCLSAVLLNACASEPKVLSASDQYILIEAIATPNGPSVTANMAQSHCQSYGASFKLVSTEVYEYTYECIY